MNRLIQVEGRPNLYRDRESGAIINTDRTAYERHLRQLESVKEEKTRIDKIENDVESIKSDISEIKSLIVSLVNKS